MQEVIHYGGHFVLPFIIALAFYRTNWKVVAFILLSTNLVDMDHLIANPVFMEDRCSIQFHWLHTYGFILIYVLMALSKGWLRIVGIGLCLHMFFDFTDCLYMYMSCQSCQEDAPAIALLRWVSTAIGL
jgi:hypothetical protein